MTVHSLKTWTEFFESIWDNKKLFELRRNDRNFKAGDKLLIREYDPAQDAYSGREVLAGITYVLSGKDSPPDWGLHPDFCIISFEVGGSNTCRDSSFSRALLTRLEAETRI